MNRLYFEFWHGHHPLYCMTSTGGEALANGFINKSLPDMDDRLFGRPQIALLIRGPLQNLHSANSLKFHTVNMM